MKLFFGVSAIVTTVLGICWWIASISVQALLHYMEKKGCTPPTSEEVGECVRWAVKRKLSKKS